MRAFELILFDYDGTLFETRPAIVHCMERAFEQRGLPIPAHQAIIGAVNTGRSLSDTLGMLDAGLRTDTVSRHELIRSYRALYASEAAPLLRPFAGTRSTLQQLHAAGVTCVIVSNKGMAAVRRSLEQHQLDCFVDWIFADELGLPTKPDPAIVTDHILPRYQNRKAAQILMVGDTESDIVFARRTGMLCCWARYGYGEVERCRMLAPDHEIARIEELPRLVLCS